MHILVLDAIHGGKDIGTAYGEAGHSVDVVDVYRGTTPDEFQRAQHLPYDFIAAPVHLDPDHPLLSRRTVPVITHHEAVRQLLGKDLPRPMIEITGAQGKTTTAHALAYTLPGDGVLHASDGTYVCPAKRQIFRKSITPASIIAAARYARQMQGWLVAEVSLGVTGAGDLSIITSPDDYPFAGGKKSAVSEKVASTKRARRVLVAGGVPCDQENVIRLEDIARCDGMKCIVEKDGMKRILTNPLFLLPPYRTPLMLAAAAAMILHVDPTPLCHFPALPGRMSLSKVKDLIIIDNANSGTNVTTTICAARYARHRARSGELTLVIGQVDGDGAVCEGFSPDQILSAISMVRPTRIVWVGRHPGPCTDKNDTLKCRIDAVAATLEEGRDTAIRITPKGSIVLSVKTWR